jgi:hypothetical protein
MTIEEEIAELQRSIHFVPSQIAQNRASIQHIKDRLHERMRVLDRLSHANQTICSHPREFIEGVLTNNTDGYNRCKLCGADLE